jgi:hypothetical protein
VEEEQLQIMVAAAVAPAIPVMVVVMAEVVELQIIGRVQVVLVDIPEMVAAAALVPAQAH